MREKITELISGICGQHIEPDMELYQSQIMSSYEILEAICEIESVFQIKFSKEQLREKNNWISINNMVKAVESVI